MANERSAVERVKAAMARPQGFPAGTVVCEVDKADLETLLASLAEKDARTGELEAFVRGDLQANFVEQGARISAASEWKSRALAAEAQVRVLEEALAEAAEGARLLRSMAGEIWCTNSPIRPRLLAMARMLDRSTDAAEALTQDQGHER